MKAGLCGIGFTQQDLRLQLSNWLSTARSFPGLTGLFSSGIARIISTSDDQAGALAALQGRAPELILADYHLDHGVVGCAVVKHLREHFACKIPAVIITADRTDQCRRALRRLEAPLLNKPVKPGKLRAVLSQLLS